MPNTENLLLTVTHVSYFHVNVNRVLKVIKFRQFIGIKIRGRFKTRNDFEFTDIIKTRSMRPKQLNKVN